MLTDLETKLLVALVPALCSFLAGLFFGPPIREWLERRRRVGVIHKKIAIPVRVFPLVSLPQLVDSLKDLLIEQNRVQSLFEFEVIDWNAWPGARAADARLGALHTDSRLGFAECFQAEMQSFPKTSVDGRSTAPRGINLAITDLPFPKNFYCWNTRDRRGIVVGIRSLQALFGSNPAVVNKIILRIVQRMLVYSLDIRQLQSHVATRGCLFDLTPSLMDLQYSANKTFLCSECERAIVDTRGVAALDAIISWVEGPRVKAATAA